MSRTKKAVIVASVMIVAGIITIISAFAANGFSWPNVQINLKDMKSENIQYEKKTEYVKDAFKSIDIESSSDIDVMVKKAEGDADYVEYYDCAGLTHHVDVKDGVLKITADDTRNSAFNISLGVSTVTWPSVTVYLAGTEYEDIKIVTGSGDVDVEYYLAVKNIDIVTSSGDIGITGANADSITVKASSGCIKLDSVATEELNLSANSGDLTLSDTVAADKAEFTTKSGDINSTNMKTESVVCNASSGDITLSDSDAAVFTIETSSGDVSVDITSNKRFNYKTKTSSGDVDVPDSYVDAEGSCEIITSSGDIDVTKRD